jgi:YggT family protein
VTQVWTIVDFILMIAQWVIIVQAILSWLIAFNVINTQNDAVRGLWNGLQKMTDPVYAPVRRILPDFGALDLSPMVVLLAIILLRTLVQQQIMFAVAG